MPSYRTLFILVRIIESFESETILSFGDSQSFGHSDCRHSSVLYRGSLRDHMRA